MAMTLRPEAGNLDDVFAGGRGYINGDIPPGDHVSGGMGPAAHIELPAPSRKAGLGAPPASTAPEPTMSPNQLKEHDQHVAATLPDEVIIEAVSRFMPKEFINLDHGKARFRGHDLDLPPETCQTIARVLADALATKLRQEIERIYGTVRDKELPTNPNSGLAHVHQMQRASGPVGEGQPWPNPEVQRMREPRSPKAPKNVRKVPRVKNGKTAPGDAA